VIDDFLYTDARLLLLRLRLVVMIYDLLLASILGVCGTLGSVAYPFSYR
jgi:hypothetical protein